MAVVMINRHKNGSYILTALYYLPYRIWDALILQGISSWWNLCYVIYILLQFSKKIFHYLYFLFKLKS